MVEQKFFVKVCKILNFPLSKALENFTDVLGLNNFHVLKGLADLNLINEACNDYTARGGQHEINFGVKMTLVVIGKKLGEMGYENFIKAVEAHDQSSRYRLGKEYPLMKLLNCQLHNVEFSEEIISFAQLLRSEVGPLTYELISQNIPIPSLSTIDKKLQVLTRIDEGVLQVLIHYYFDFICL